MCPCIFVYVRVCLCVRVCSGAVVVRLCLCVSLCVRACACDSVCVRDCPCPWICSCVFMCVRVCLCVFVRARVYWGILLCVRMSLRVLVWLLFVRVCSSVSVCSCVFVCVHVCSCVLVCACGLPASEDYTAASFSARHRFGDGALKRPRARRQAGIRRSSGSSALRQLLHSKPMPHVQLCNTAGCGGFKQLSKIV